MKQDFRHVARLQEFQDVAKICTVSQAAERCNVSEARIRELVALEYVAAVTTDTGLILSVSSLQRLFPAADLSNLHI